MVLRSYPDSCIRNKKLNHIAPDNITQLYPPFPGEPECIVQQVREYLDHLRLISHHDCLAVIKVG